MTVPKNRQVIQLHLMEVSALHGKLLTSLHRLYKIVSNDSEDASKIEDIISTLDKIPALQQYLREKYQK